MSNSDSAYGKLSARPGLSSGVKISTAGIVRLDVGDQRECLLYVPQNYRADNRFPLILALHGASGNANTGLSLFQRTAEATNAILLVPSSKKRTWDMLIRNYAEDVKLIDRALAHVFKSYQIDESKLAIGGFSDGASYALSLGLANGDLFTHVMAFSPGFVLPLPRQGSPRIYISHGLRDAMLPVDRCSRKIVAQLQRENYDVFYHEFDGSHSAPVKIVQEAMGWFLSSK